MYNGIVSLTLTAPGGVPTSVTYNGSDNLLETQNSDDNRGYWDVIWNIPGEHGRMDKFLGTSYNVILEDENQIEISFSRGWEFGSEKVPLNIDKRFVMLRDSPGFYTYAVVEKLQGWPAFDIQEGRFLLKLQANKFHYMAMSDVRQRVMPMPIDRSTGVVLAYPEAVLLTNPTNPELKGEVDDKYLYSCDNKDNKVHGWVSSELGAGMWMITPSNEFKTGGPLKQDLTSHVGPTMLSMFISTHYAGEDQALKFEADEYWKKVFGPFLVYFNSDDASAEVNPSILWEDAKQKASEEVRLWPYDFPISEHFLKSDQRGAISGQLHVYDRYIDKDVRPGAEAYVGLATPGEPGSWQKESKGYQFWTQADDDGNFWIKNVVPGTYGLFAWVPGTIGDYKYDCNITILPGFDIKLDNLVFNPPRKGPTMWEIGIPDRTAAEFFIPDPTNYKIHLYENYTERFRQYGLWYRYKDLYPLGDLNFTIGKSDYKEDWFFAHVTRNVGYREYEATTRRILFDLENVKKGENYTLQLALASANGAELQVRFNDRESDPDFTTNLIGKDNGVARHGIHGLYHLYSIDVSGSRLVDGENTIFLTQAINTGPFKEVMYDYIRFEGPASEAAPYISEIITN
ncbi:uncharacterized protein [Henckelia pumila]|uniref:uncharacterized protein n=1 Tax=Henckelia pumila TaxID=405737 RepID=UPI003C6E9CA6